MKKNIVFASVNYENEYKFNHQKKFNIFLEMTTKIPKEGTVFTKMFIFTKSYYTILTFHILTVNPETCELKFVCDN